MIPALTTTDTVSTLFVTTATTQLIPISAYATAGVVLRLVASLYSITSISRIRLYPSRGGFRMFSSHLQPSLPLLSTSLFQPRTLKWQPIEPLSSVGANTSSHSLG
ncbi:hypothetical protein ACHAWO_000879 [Cyclotella atomus]|uniref:Uncharacterized protein n=1 Tax=Cyclotella atomus TaxID=382360 RepID=A0ABD3P1C5_9STRA